MASAGHSNALITAVSQPPHDADEPARDAAPLPLYPPPIHVPFRRFSPLLLPLVLLPLCILALFILAPGSEMGNAGNFFKSVLLPALISLALYLLLHYAIVPLYRRHRARYSQYLPISAPSSSTGFPSNPFPVTLPNLRSSLLSFFIPSRWAERAWQRRNADRGRVVNAEDDDEELGEDLDFEIGDELEEDRERRRRDGLSLSIDASRMGVGTGRRQREASSDRRLSRELEEGFADSSDEEEDEIPGHRR